MKTSRRQLKNAARLPSWPRSPRLKEGRKYFFVAETVVGRWKCCRRRIAAKIAPRMMPERFPSAAISVLRRKTMTRAMTPSNPMDWSAKATMALIRKRSRPARIAKRYPKKTEGGMDTRTRTASAGVAPFKKEGCRCQYIKDQRKLAIEEQRRPQKIPAGSHSDDFFLASAAHRVMGISQPRPPTRTPNAMAIRQRLIWPRPAGPSSRA